MERSQMRRLAITMLVASAVVVGGPAGARAEEGAASGKRLRITVQSRSTPYVGTLVAADDTTLTILSNGEKVAVPRGSVTKIEQSDGRSNKYLVVGIVLGAVAGAGVGCLPSRTKSESWSNRSCGYGCTSSGSTSTTQSYVPLYIAIGAGSAAAIGALIGRLIGPERWRASDTLQVEVGVRPVSGRGAQLLVSARF